MLVHTPQTYKVKVELEFSEEQLIDLINQGLKGATQYWVDEINVDDPTGEYYDEGKAIVIAKFTVKLHDAEEDKWKRLSLGMVQKGLAAYMKESGKLDTDSYDMYDAEQVIQCALYGKTVYA